MTATLTDEKLRFLLDLWKGTEKGEIVRELLRARVVLARIRNIVKESEHD